MARLVSLVSLGLFTFVCLSCCMNQVVSANSLRVTLLEVLRELARRDLEMDSPQPNTHAARPPGQYATDGDTIECSIINEDTGKCRAGGTSNLLNDRPIFGEFRLRLSILL